MANFDEMAHFLTLLEAHGARRAKGARTISDARGSNDARGIPLIPTTHPRFASARPVVPPRGRPPFPSSFFLGYLNLGQCTGQPFERSVWLTDHTLLHSLLGAMVN